MTDGGYTPCWRKDYQGKEAHLLPAKYLAAWIANNVYLPLVGAPVDRDDATLNPGSGACFNCPRRSRYASSLNLPGQAQKNAGMPTHSKPAKMKRDISPEGRARIAEAGKLCWAK
jgi:ParB family transcriptional regulator, chromosome partitioning protein